jgi:hypothetical protein
VLLPKVPNHNTTPFVLFFHLINQKHALCIKMARSKPKPAKRTRDTHGSESEDSPRPKRNRQTRPVDAFWDDEDQEKLEATHAAEITLWNKCERFLGVPPPEIFGDAEFVQLAKLLPNDAPGDIKKIWPIIFCNNLSELISCPYFKNRPSYVLYVLQVAMYWRLMRDETPDMTLLLSDRNDDIIDLVRRRVQERSEEFSDELARDIRTSLTDRLGKDVPAHYKFLYGIQGTNSASRI